MNQGRHEAKLHQYMMLAEAACRVLDDLMGAQRCLCARGGGNPRASRHSVRCEQAQTALSAYERSKREDECREEKNV